jgi:hypothetical protein
VQTAIDATKRSMLARQRRNMIEVNEMLTHENTDVVS